VSFYQQREIAAIYSLGRMYFEMGYFAAAERIFLGLLRVDASFSPARLGLGFIKLERGLYPEAVEHLRIVIEQERFVLEAKLALSLCFIAMGELPRAKSLLIELGPQLEASAENREDFRALWHACALRCDQS